MGNHLCCLPLVMRQDSDTNTSPGTGTQVFALQLSYWFLMKQNPCSQEQFSPHALTPLSKMKLRVLSFLFYRNINWTNDALGSTIPSCHFLSLGTNARCPEVQSASCSSRGQQGRRMTKAAARKGPDWNLVQGRCSREFFCPLGRSYNGIKVFK